MNAVSINDKLKDHCFICGLSLVEIPLRDTWLCEVTDIPVNLRWSCVKTSCNTLLTTFHLLAMKPKTPPSYSTVVSVNTIFLLPLRVESEFIIKYLGSF